MPTRSILERVTAGDILVMDGGTGSELQKRGVDVMRGTTVEGRRMGPEKYKWTTGHGVWSATATLEAPDVVRQIHEDYLRAGADIIISNNFYTCPAMLQMIGEEDRWEEYTRRAAELALQARDSVNPEAYVAGGFAPPYSGDLKREFGGMARVLAECGVDFLLPEYMGGSTVCESPIADCVTAVEVCAATGLPVFLGVCCVTDKGTMYHGESFRELAEALAGCDLAGILLMCSYPDEISVCLPELRKVFSGPIGAYGHIGYNENEEFGSSPDEPYFSIDIGEYTPERYAEFASDWKKVGAQIIGGCCATTPEHIAALPAAVGR